LQKIFLNSILSEKEVLSILKEITNEILKYYLVLENINGLDYISSSTKL